MSGEVRRRRFPQLAASGRIADLSLTTRVQNCLHDLEKHHGLTDISHLSHITIDELLRLKNFGRKSLIDLLSSVLPVILDHTTDLVGVASCEREPVSVTVTRAAERLRAQPYAARVRCSDARFKSEAGTLLFIATQLLTGSLAERATTSSGTRT
jgi:hypothetical protein